MIRPERVDRSARRMLGNTATRVHQAALTIVQSADACGLAWHETRLAQAAARALGMRGRTASPRLRPIARGPRPLQ